MLSAISACSIELAASMLSASAAMGEKKEGL